MSAVCITTSPSRLLSEAGVVGSLARSVQLVNSPSGWLAFRKPFHIHTRSHACSLSLALPSPSLSLSISPPAAVATAACYLARISSLVGGGAAATSGIRTAAVAIILAGWHVDSGERDIPIHFSQSYDLQTINMYIRILFILTDILC